MMALLKETMGYAVASTIALGADITLLWIFVHFLGWPYLISATVSFTLGAVVAYELSIRIAFTHRRLNDKRTELATFVAIGIVGLLVNVLVIFCCVNFFEVKVLAAKCVAAGFTFATNFIVRRQLLFSQHVPALKER